MKPKLKMPVAGPTLCVDGVCVGEHTLRELLKDRARLDFLEAQCEVSVSTSEEGADLLAHNRFLNPHERQTLRTKIDAARR